MKPGEKFCPECFKNGTTKILPSKVNPCPNCGYNFPPAKSRSTAPPDENLVRAFVAKCGGVEQAKAAIDRFSAELQEQDLPPEIRQQLRDLDELEKLLCDPYTG